MQVWVPALLSVIIVSLVSFVGLAALSVKNLKGKLLYLVSFSAGALFGDALIHLLPEAAEAGFTLTVSLMTLAGVLFSFVVEKFIHWRHCHVPTSKEHPHPFAVMNLVGDGVHNLIDGLIIGASYLASVPVGIATTIAVVFHEIPQEIGDFGVLLHGGFTRGKALLFNFLTALAAVLGAGIALAMHTAGLTILLIPFAAGNFIYIAAADLIPEIHKETSPWRSVLQLVAFAAGIGVMALLLLME